MGLDVVLWAPDDGVDLAQVRAVCDRVSHSELNLHHAYRAHLDDNFGDGPMLVVIDAGAKRYTGPGYKRGDWLSTREAIVALREVLPGLHYTQDISFMELRENAGEECTDEFLVEMDALWAEMVAEDPERA